MIPADSKLILLINECARSLPSQAYEMAAELSKIANEIEAPETREKALRSFDEYAWHYKGLSDIAPPGVERSDWTKIVTALCAATRAAMQTRNSAM